MEEQVINKQEVDKGPKEVVPKEYRTLLSPCNIPSGDTSHLAVDDLKFALEQSDSRNIAITGHYGSGKSSVANTCIDEMGIADKVLRISMSTFSLPTEDEDQNSNEIEYKIVQHLLYKCDKNKIPYSGFKRINEPEERNYERHIVYILIALACFVIAFEPPFLRIDSFYDGYYRLLGDKAGWWINLIADVCSVGYLAWFLFWAGKKTASKLNQIRNIKIEAKGVTLEASSDVNVSVFNKYLDEIIYIIQENQYDFILFEDLDRLDNSDKLFLKIRELNMLINESETFKKRGRIVRFIYAIRDDVFTRELRTKCFDYIVAVVPVVDHYNVTDYLIKQYKNKGLFKTVEIPVLEQLLSRVAGLRELKNIINEYTLFQKSLKTHLSGDDENYEQKLLAVIVYKNLFPQDFAKAYLKQGLFYAIFKNKFLFSEDETKELREKANASIQSMNEAREKIVNIRKQYLEKLNDEVEVTSLIKDGYDYTLGQVASKDNLFELFINDEFDRYTYNDHNREETGSMTYNFEFDEIEKKVTEDMGYYEAIDEHSQAYNRNNDERLKLEKEIKVIENTALREILRKIGGEKARAVFNKIYVKEYPAKEDEPQTVNDEMIETLLTMIYGGYITEDYYLYISKFYEGATSESDYQFTNAVLQGAERPYDQKLNNVKSVIRKFRVEDFKNKSILNYDILNYLLDNKEEHFLSSFIETARKNPEFIVSYSQMSETINDQFFTRVFDGWDSCVNIIKGQEKSENSDALLKLFFREAPVNIRITDEEKKWLNTQYPFVNTNIKFLKITKLKKFTTTYSLKFDNLVKGKDEAKDFYEYCLTFKRFAINQKNLQVILGETWDQKPMTSIIELENDKLRKYLMQDINQLVSLFPETCDDEGRTGLIYLIESSGLDIDWLKKYTGRQKYVFDDLEDIKVEGAELLLGIDKIKATWENVYDAFKLLKGSAIDTLKAYVEKHVDELAGQKCELPDDQPVELQEALMVRGNLPFEVFVKLITCFDLVFIHEDILQIKDEERTRELLIQDSLQYDRATLSFISESFSQQLTADYFVRYYDDIMADSEVDVKEYVNNVLCIKLLNSELDLEKKGNFLLAYADIDTTKDDASYLAGMICQFYLTHGFAMGVRQELLAKALRTYRDENDWFLKIRLINKYNATMSYEKDFEKELIDTLGGEYKKLNTLYGRAKFDINEENESLLSFLKEKGHYVNDFNVKFDEKENVDKYFVSFKNSMPGEYVNAALV